MKERKCTVCGEILKGDEKPEHCPVCNVQGKWIVSVVESMNSISSRDLSSYDREKYDIRNGILLKYKGNDHDIILPNCITGIDKYAFEQTRGIIYSIVIPEGIKRIEPSTFHWCYHLGSLTLPESLETIGEWAFSGCDSLKALHIPDNTRRIERGAFINCKSLESINIPKNVHVLEEEVFGYTGLKVIRIPNNVDTVESRCFCYCQQLERVTLENEVYWEQKELIPDWKTSEVSYLNGRKEANLSLYYSNYSDTFVGCTRLFSDEWGITSTRIKNGKKMLFLADTDYFRNYYFVERRVYNPYYPI